MSAAGGLDARASSADADAAAPAPARAAHATPQLITELPTADAAALATFHEIADCEYQSSRMGRTRGQDDPQCECTPARGACTDEAGCLNRLTQVECLPDMCRCGKLCENQRFQQHKYAQVDIVQTEKKGFGLRAQAPLARDDFVYEYIGEVINHDTFLRRMAQYKTEHIEHFYFMMLQRDEYIDATKRGARSRFINHSCQPNCYVSKWHVGQHVRMGIFAKRTILAGEELTFNYNVDRYGNDPQPCYCGEPNCVGTLGGRTQTDAVTMDERFVAALGIADQVAALRASLPRGRRSKILDEDFHPVLHAVAEDDCARVMTAVRDATSNRKMLTMLLTRVQMTTDVSVNKTLVKMHGFVVLAGVMAEWADDDEVVAQVLQCLAQWPLLARDKVVDSGMDEQVRHVADTKGANAPAAQALVHAWDQLPSTFRIARRENDAGSSQDDATWAARRRAEAARAAQASTAAGDDDAEALRRSLRAYREHDREAPADVRAPRPREEKKVETKPVPLMSIEDIIKRAYAEIEAQPDAEPEPEPEPEPKPSRGARPAGAAPPARPEKRARTEVDLPTLERQLVKQVSALVVKQLSKVKDQLDRDRFKRYARELTTLLCSKEMRHTSWPPRLADGTLQPVVLSDDKRRKMKVFAHDYIKKLVRHRRTKAAGADTSMDASQQLDASMEASQQLDTSMDVSQQLDASVDDVAGS